MYPSNISSSRYAASMPPTCYLSMNKATAHVLPLQPTTHSLTVKTGTLVALNNDNDRTQSGTDLIIEDDGMLS